MIARDIMTADPETIEVTDTIGRAVEILYTLDVRHLPVLSRGELVGVLSDRDLTAYSPSAMAAVRNPERASQRLAEPVSAIMRGDVVSVDAEDNVSEIVRLMIDHKYGAIPVVDSVEGGLVGIVSYLDVLKAVEEIVEDL